MALLVPPLLRDLNVMVVEYYGDIKVPRYLFEPDDDAWITALAFFRLGAPVPNFICKDVYAGLLQRLDPRARWLYEYFPELISPMIEKIKKESRGRRGRPRYTTGLPLEDLRFYLSIQVNTVDELREGGDCLRICISQMHGEGNDGIPYKGDISGLDYCIQLVALLKYTEQDILEVLKYPPEPHWQIDDKHADDYKRNIETFLKHVVPQKNDTHTSKRQRVC